MEKWKAWYELIDMESENAKKIYIKKVKEIWLLYGLEVLIWSDIISYLTYLPFDL